MNIEKLQHHVNHLQQQHDDLDKQIQTDFTNYENDGKLTDLKKKKLHLRDEIELFKKQIKELSNA